MRGVMFGHPGQKIASEPIRVSLFSSFDGSPEPSQLCKLARIRKVSSASEWVGLRSAGHLNSLYLSSQWPPADVSDGNSWR
jgi:hypothetical protein